MMNLDPRMTVKELLERYPQAISAFMKGNMSCVGCPTEAFHTLEDAARIHGLQLEDLLAAILNSVEAQEKTLIEPGKSRSQNGEGGQG